MTEPVRPPRHRRGPARPARRGRRRAAGATLDGIEDGDAAAACRSRPRASRSRRSSPSRTPGCDWTRPAFAVDRLDPRLHAGARRLDDVPRRAAQARPGAPVPPSGPLPSRRRWPRVSSRCNRRSVLVGTGTGRCCSARCSRRQAADAGRRLGPRRPDRARRAVRRESPVRPDVQAADRPISRGGPADGPRGPAGHRRPEPVRRAIRATVEHGPPDAGPAAADPARRAAYDVLRAVEPSATPTPTWCCPGCCGSRRIAGRDAAFATELTYGTLRWQGTYDAVLGRLPGQAARRVDPRPARRAAAGRAPAARMRVPAHAAVSETVDLVRDGHRHRPQRLRQRGAAPDRRARPGRLGGRARPRPSSSDPVGHLAIAAEPPGVDRAGAARRPGRARR